MTLQLLCCFVDVLHPICASGGYATVGTYEDEVGQFPDAPLLRKRAGEAAEITIAGVVDAVNSLETGELLLVGFEGITDEADFLAFPLHFATEAAGAV